MFYVLSTLEVYSFPENIIPIFIEGKGVVVPKVIQKSENLNIEIFRIVIDGSEYTYTYIDRETSQRSPIKKMDGIRKQ